MTDKKTSRRELMRPVQLLSIAFGAALFAGFVTAMSSGMFQGENVWTLTLVMTGSTFIVVLLLLSMLVHVHHHQIGDDGGGQRAQQ